MVLLYCCCKLFSTHCYNARLLDYVLVHSASFTLYIGHCILHTSQCTVPHSDSILHNELLTASPGVGAGPLFPVLGLPHYH